MVNKHKYGPLVLWFPSCLVFWPSSLTVMTQFSNYSGTVLQLFRPFSAIQTIPSFPTIMIYLVLHPLLQFLQAFPSHSNHSQQLFNCSDLVLKPLRHSTPTFQPWPSCLILFFSGILSQFSNRSGLVSQPFWPCCQTIPSSPTISDLVLQPFLTQFSNHSGTLLQLYCVSS